MKVIKNEKGIFMELPRESIKFYGNTPEQKKANEVIYDLSLENDSLYQQITQLTNNWNELEKDINNQLMMTRKFDDYNEGYFNATLHYYNKMKEISGGEINEENKTSNN